MEDKMENQNNKIDTLSKVDLSTYEARRKFNLHPNDRVYDSFIFSKPEYIDIYANTYEYLTEVDSTIHSVLYDLATRNGLILGGTEEIISV